MGKKRSQNLALLLIVLIGLTFRLYGINWDSGFHLHPDERMLIMVADRINFFTQLNPHFFNYGSLPIYLLKGISQLIDLLLGTNIATYNGMLYIGRILSTFADIGVILLIYKITLLLFTHSSEKKARNKIALLSSFLYSITFFPIQNSHFFIVDTFLTLFSTLLLYLLLKLLQKRKISPINSITLGIISAMILTTKVSGAIFVGMAGLFIIILTFLQKTKSKIKDGVINISIFSLSLLVSSFTFMPYAFIMHTKFINDVVTQVRMNSDPYVFPYTLQYVGTTPYVYHLKNIFLWGLGPVISFLSLVGITFLTKNFRLKTKNYKNKFLFLLFSGYYLIYFLIIGHSAVKFMRYMLPIYPFLAILAGYGLYKIDCSKLKALTVLEPLLLIISTLWTLTFVSIYSKPNTRIMATNWINQNIKPHKTLGVEHWDDRLPIYGGDKYNFEELPLYNLPDDNLKWRDINLKLIKLDYIIIASNRLYVPLQRLTNCKKYEVCYPKTAEYYQRLFNNKPLLTSFGLIRFKKVAEFAVYPKLTIGPWQLKINDQKADESFTVYDHPKIIIFKKTNDRDQKNN